MTRLILIYLLVNGYTGFAKTYSPVSITGPKETIEVNIAKEGTNGVAIAVNGLEGKDFFLGLEELRGAWCKVTERRLENSSSYYKVDSILENQDECNVIFRFPYQGYSTIRLFRE